MTIKSGSGGRAPSARPGGHGRISARVVSVSAAMAALLGSVAGCGSRQAQQPNSRLVQELKRENLELRRRIAALEASRTADSATAEPNDDNVRMRVAALEAGKASERAIIEALREENSLLRQRLEAAAAQGTPPSVVLPEPRRSTSTPRAGNHYSHRSHSSHRSHRSHSSHRSHRSSR